MEKTVLENIKNFFYPDSICVVGASTKEKSIGYELLRTMLNYGFKGKIFPVNPRAEEILGLKCFHTIEEIEEVPSLGIIVTPRKFVEDSINSLLAIGTKSFILITAGYKESGQEGAEAEQRIKQIVTENGGNLVGPNCMGVINTVDDVKLNATFVAEKPEKGTIGFLSQSGALGAAVLNSLRTSDIRFAHFISVGNKADLTENEITHFWNSDPNVQILTYYLESFENGLAFLLPFIKGEIEKPAIVLKAGRTSGGIKAAQSHTGALSSKDSVVSALLRQFGIIRAENVDELFNIAKGFENFPLPKGNRVGIVTNAGGPAILAVDALEKEGLELARFSEATLSKLKTIAPPNGSIKNPIDLLPGGTSDIYVAAIETILQDENVDSVISVFVEPVMVEPFGVVEKINAIKSDKPILQVVMPLPEFWEKYRKNSNFKKPLFRRPEEPAKVISEMLFHSKRSKELAKNRNDYLDSLAKLKLNKIERRANFLPPKETEEFLKKKGFPVANEIFLTYEEIKNFDGNIFPLVIKGFAEGVTHKTEFKAVKLNIKNKEELLQGAFSIKKSFEEKGKNLLYFILQPHLKFENEFLIGASRHPSFGPIVMFGTGGKYVELFNDVSIRSALLSKTDAEEMIFSTKAGKILKGYRNEEKTEIETFVRLLRETAYLMLSNPEIMELDFNPVVISNGKPVITDSRIKKI